MIDERTFLKLPISFKDICKIYPPSVNEVVNMEKFDMYRAALTLSQEEIDDAYSDSTMNLAATRESIPTPFQYLMISYYQDGDDMKEIILNAFEFFLKEPITILPELELIIIGKKEEDINPDIDLENPRTIDGDNFFDFQNKVRYCMGIEPIEKPNLNEDPRVRRIKALGRKRERTKAKKSNQSLGSLLAAICCMGIGLTPLNIGEISYASVAGLIETYQGKEAYDIDIRCLLAGADSKKIKPKYWIK